ncbi:MAG TPA: nucleotidyltransferase domain-containing protein [bacterium]|nr:nucleotidyltransferase domain-containing protein [bacterium]
MNKDELLQRIKERLQGTFRERLKGVVLYGSEARGEAKGDSDFDLLVLLQGPLNFGDDLMTIIHVLYPLQLEIVSTDELGERLIHASPADIADYEAGEFSFYRNVRREGKWL